ncbi:MAG: hypothetical protein J6C55_03620 [Oscillospiraceae bacterium]|nr:hypothetical protein [Oscillospiraceae bacterium]
MIKSKIFKISFISTIIFIITILLFLITDHNTKNNNFRNSPSIFKIQNIDFEYFDLELAGNKFKISPLKSNINKNHKLIIRALLPKKTKIIEGVVYLTYVAFNELIQKQKNLDYIKNTQIK